jgi:hypothetical protein
MYTDMSDSTTKKRRDFLYLVCEAIGTAATPGLLCQPRVTVKMIVERQMECRLARETEVLGENPPQRHFCLSQNPTWPDPGLNTGRRGEKPANRLSYGAANEEVSSVVSRTTFVADIPGPNTEYSGHLQALFVRTPTLHANSRRSVPSCPPPPLSDHARDLHIPLCTIPLQSLNNARRGNHSECLRFSITTLQQN